MGSLFSRKGGHKATVSQQDLAVLVSQSTDPILAHLPPIVSSS